MAQLTSEDVLPIFVTLVPDSVHLLHQRVTDEHTSSTKRHSTKRVELVLCFGCGTNYSKEQTLAELVQQLMSKPDAPNHILSVSYLPSMRRRVS